jgi:hypothetical protein
METALRLLLSQGSTPTRRLTWTREGGVYHVRVVKVGAESGAPNQWLKVVLQNTRVRDLLPRLRESLPDATNLIAHDADNAILIEAPADKMSAAREIVAMLDVAPRNVVLKAEVVMVANGGADAATVKPGANRNVLLATVLRTVSGQTTDGEDKITGAPSQSARLGLTATATRLGDGNYEVQTRWDVSLPLTVARSGTLSNTSRFRPGDTNIVGGIVLSQYGLKGQILFFVTLTEVTDTPPKP